MQFYAPSGSDSKAVAMAVRNKSDSLNDFGESTSSSMYMSSSSKSCKLTSRKIKQAQQSNLKSPSCLYVRPVDVVKGILSRVDDPAATKQNKAAARHMHRVQLSDHICHSSYKAADWSRRGSYLGNSLTISKPQLAAKISRGLSGNSAVRDRSDEIKVKLALWMRTQGARLQDLVRSRRINSHFKRMEQYKADNPVLWCTLRKAIGALCNSRIAMLLPIQGSQRQPECVGRLGC